MDLSIRSETTCISFAEWKSIQLRLLTDELQNSFIKNDRNECRDLYFRLCKECGLHQELEPEEYSWPWVFESNLDILQQAPERKYTNGKKQLTLSDLRTFSERFLLETKTASD